MAVVNIAALAESDLDEIFACFSENDVDSAVRFLGELGQKFAVLAENPAVGRERNDFVVGMRSFPYKKYVIYYFPILHAARNTKGLFEDYFEGLKP